MQAPVEWSNDTTFSEKQVTHVWKIVLSARYERNHEWQEYRSTQHIQNPATAFGDA